MKEITFEDIAEFIDNQPDEKTVNFDENDSDSPCGCIMVQYGKSIGLKFTRCYVTHFGVPTVARLTGCTFQDFMPASDRAEFTYKELKEKVATERLERATVNHESQ